MALRLGGSGMTFSATMFWHCKCGAEVHVVMECDVSDVRRDPLPVSCWSCMSTVGKVAAVEAFTAATGQAALKAALIKRVLALQ